MILNPANPRRGWLERLPGAHKRSMSCQWCCEAPTVPKALGYGQTPTPTPKENVGVTIYTYPSKSVLLMLKIRYFCIDDQVERAYL